MNKYAKLLSTVLALSITLPVYAGFKSDTPKKVGNWNAITIFNNTDTDIAYTVMGAYGGAVYGIKSGLADIYHSGVGDEYAYFMVGTCQHMTNNGGRCDQAGPQQVCPNSHYNADLIKAIYINSLTSCTVTCLDGSDTSCKQSG